MKANMNPYARSQHCLAGRHHYCSKGHLSHVGEGGAGLMFHLRSQASDLPKATQWIPCGLCTRIWLFQSESRTSLLHSPSPTWYQNGILLLIKYFSPGDFLTVCLQRLSMPEWWEITTLKSDKSGFKSRLCHFLAVCLWVSHWTSLTLDFSMYKMEIMTYSMY